MCQFDPAPRRRSCRSGATEVHEIPNAVVPMPVARLTPHDPARPLVKKWG